MGTFCSTDKGADPDEHEKDPHKSQPHHHPLSTIQLRIRDKMAINQQQAIASGEQVNGHLDFKFQNRDSNPSLKSSSMDDEDEAALNRMEDKAIKRMKDMRAKDDARFKAKDLLSTGHFLDIKDEIDKKELYQIARMAPKGAHLHLHFNSTLLPHVLLGYAADMDNMFIWSDMGLDEKENFDTCKVEFSLKPLGEIWQALPARKRQKLAAEISQKDPAEKKFAPEIVSKLRGLGSGGSQTFEREELQALEEHYRSELKAQINEHGPNLFRPGYQKNGPMLYQYFRELWDKEADPVVQKTCDKWLISKLVFSQAQKEEFFRSHGALFKDDVESEVDKGISETQEKINRLQSDGKSTTAETQQLEWFKVSKKRIVDMPSQHDRNRESARRAWDAFNGRTKMMKGLFNYQRAFRAYTRECLEAFVKDNVQYAEIRPNFMKTNQVFNDNGWDKIDNEGMMEIIIEEYEQFMKDIGDMDSKGKIRDGENHRPIFSGMKVIYCTPRSFSREQVKDALRECLEFKEKWPRYIAGFDLVGEESFPKPFPLKHFEEEFKNFQSICEDKGLTIPFLFHCGETPDDLEGNLDTALELNARRIGHGYALPKKPQILSKMKENKVCVESCPISNMVLGLAETMAEHSIYQLLDEEMHCALSSDNGTLFQSTLSHDFYEVLAGHADINLLGWKQLALWSIEHSVFDKEYKNERLAMKKEWEARWREFVTAIHSQGSINQAEDSPPHRARLAKLEEARDLKAKREAGVRKSTPASTNGTATEA
ncbi:hypothetical protein GGR57DRAFT_452280 [Xylariaceae sp. FL1272]|nr:hypothetical protein GGR57DRAFT_452280 [Xylariaceae sp. FL1272]